MVSAWVVSLFLCWWWGCCRAVVLERLLEEERREGVGDVSDFIVEMLEKEGGLWGSR